MKQNYQGVGLNLTSELLPINAAKIKQNFGEIKKIEIAYLHSVVVLTNEGPRKKGFCSSQSLGMKLVNLSVIGEDNQNEIRAVQPISPRADYHAFLQILYKLIFADQISDGLQKHEKDYQHHILWLGDIGQGSLDHSVQMHPYFYNFIRKV